MKGRPVKVWLTWYNKEACTQDVYDYGIPPNKRLILEALAEMMEISSPEDGEIECYAVVKLNIKTNLAKMTIDWKETTIK